MSLSYAHRASLYHGLGQLVRTGITLPKAIEKLAMTQTGPAKQLLQRVHRRLMNGSTAGESFASEVPPLEYETVSAVEKGGRLEQGFFSLSHYFDSLARARGSILAKCAYPVFLANFGILLLGASTLVQQGVMVYAEQTITLLIWFWGGAVALYLFFRMLLTLGAESPFFDALLRAIPMLGGVRTAFAAARFCLTYHLQLAAGVNSPTALASAGRASGSGLIRVLAHRVVRAMLKGEQAGPLLSVGTALPSEVLQAIMVGEETGQLDAELMRTAEAQQTRAEHKLNALAEWLPRFLYLAVAAVIAWKIISFYQGYYQQLDALFE